MVRPIQGLTLPAIPWVFEDLAAIKRWVWHTPHFVARISSGNTQGDTASEWEVSDLIRPAGGMPRLIADGVCGGFTAAEVAVREVIGKAYTTRLGYAAWAGPYATTFTLLDGTDVDLGPLAGMRVSITVRLPNGTDEVQVGILRIRDFALRLRTAAGQVYQVNPAHVVSVEPLDGESAGARPEYLGHGRLYRSVAGPGCTGVPGPRPGTVDHVGPRCPVHESDHT